MTCSPLSLSFPSSSSPSRTAVVLPERVLFVVDPCLVRRALDPRRDLHAAGAVVHPALPLAVLALAAVKGREEPAVARHRAKGLERRRRRWALLHRGQGPGGERAGGDGGREEEQQGGLETEEHRDEKGRDRERERRAVCF